jgi:hypothetical protein
MFAARLYRADRSAALDGQLQSLVGRRTRQSAYEMTEAGQLPSFSDGTRRLRRSSASEGFREGRGDSA